MTNHCTNVPRSEEPLSHRSSQDVAAWTLLVVASCMAAALCGCGRQGDKHGAETNASFFPIAVGNQWTYRRTVFPENIVGIMDPYHGTPAISPTMKSGEETYVVISRSDKGFAVEGKDSDGKKIFDIFEPIDFFETELIMWKRSGMPDTLVYEEARTGRIWGKSGTARTMICLLTPNTSLEDVGDLFKRKVTCLRSSALVAVPAGTFHDTLKNIISSMNPLTSQEFYTERIFAKGVGCVKETRFNASGKITYQLELVTCRIAGDK